jgi:hypothetical protein
VLFAGVVEQPVEGPDGGAHTAEIDLTEIRASVEELLAGAHSER